ncbi:MAG: hypothetical protein PVJ21_06660 [Anaerolineales bacterium]|jgi:hypothetical protein
MKRNRVILFLAVLVIASLACGFFGGGDGTGVNAPGTVSPSTGSEEEAESYDFPTPPDTQNLTEMGTGGINFQTSMSLDEVVTFYRNAFESSGYNERDILTVINDTTFSIVWDGHPSGQAIVVQGVDLGDGTVNVNVHFEDT